LIVYIGRTHPELLVDYRDSYGLTLLHIVFHGNALNVDTERWFDHLVFFGVDPLVKSYPEDGSAKANGQYGLQTVHELAVFKLNYNVLVKCVSYGANVNEFELDNNRNKRNILQEIIFRYSDEYRKKSEIKSVINNIIWFLVYYGIDLSYRDNTDKDIRYYTKKFNVEFLK
jgi:hypothetical protein